LEPKQLTEKQSKVMKGNYKYLNYKNNWSYMKYII
jgi:hypothetical protein